MTDSQRDLTREKVRAHDVFLDATRQMQVREYTVRLSQQEQQPYYNSTPDYARHGVWAYAWTTGWLACWRELNEQIVAGAEKQPPPEMQQRPDPPQPEVTGRAVGQTAEPGLYVRFGGESDGPWYRSAFVWFNPLSAVLLSLAVLIATRSQEAMYLTFGGIFGGFIFAIIVVTGVLDFN